MEGVLAIAQDVFCSDLHVEEWCPKKQLEARIRMFQEEHWLQFLNDSSICAEKAHQQSVRRRRRGDGDAEAKRNVSRESWRIVRSHASAGRSCTRSWDVGHSGSADRS